MGHVVPLPWADCDVARELARTVWRTDQPWFQRLADLERAGRARIAAGEIGAGLDIVLTIAGLEPPLRATPPVRRALRILKTNACDAILAAALARRGAQRAGR